MPRFRARFVGKNGRRRTVRWDAVDRESLSEQIEAQLKGYVIDIRKMREPRRFQCRMRISGRMLLTALDSLELMLSSGVRVNTAVRKIAEFAPPGVARRLWTDIVISVEETGSLGAAFERFPEVFNESMVGVILAHEAAGSLAAGVKTVRNYVVQMQEIRRESMRGAAYPGLICAAGFAASAVLCIFTLPRFSRMLTDIGVVNTNRVTEIFFLISKFVVEEPGFMMLAMCLPFAGVWLAFLPRFRPVIDHLALRLPILRSAIEALVMARVCVTFKALSESGVRVVESLEACASAAGNAAFANGIWRVVAAVRENSAVGTGFEQAGVFAPEVVLAIKSGEGRLPEVFGRLASYYTAESKHRISVALQMVEPVMLLFVLVWVLGIALAVILPLVEILDSVR